MADKIENSSGEEQWKIEGCTKCTLCWKEEPGCFAEGKDGLATIHTLPNTTKEKSAVAAMANLCPVNAIKRA